jgi:hypothetical protein
MDLSDKYPVKKSMLNNSYECAQVLLHAIERHDMKCMRIQVLL